MPKIERDIPYTFSAYSGGALKPLAAAAAAAAAGGQRARAAGAEKEGKDDKAAGRKGKADDDRDCDKRGEKGDFKDVYNFEEEDDDESNETKEPVCSISRPKSASVAQRKSAAPLRALPT